MSEGFKEQKRVIYFSSGETLEEEDSDEEEKVPVEEQMFREPEDTPKLPWRAVPWSLGRKSLRTCNFLGEKLAGLLGLNTAKYQYAIDEYQRDSKKTGRKETESSYEERRETIELSSRINNEYGATTMHIIGSQPTKNTKHKTTGSHNNGYQEG
ncbi:hypothetical protein DPEC_G00086040 [Dallia pectoralis]|uniref:Uncharacterized protein n=1 Tax=Dallia pectoralis TaxID=75939 RepID=A0ACC2H097_DALPE|nr:hypothetical protein DPEC_G00086040 [Dallia pectoralis]